MRLSVIQGVLGPSDGNLRSEEQIFLIIFVDRKQREIRKAAAFVRFKKLNFLVGLFSTLLGFDWQKESRQRRLGRRTLLTPPSRNIVSSTHTR